MNLRSLSQRIIRPEIQAIGGYAVPSAVGMIKLDAMENPFSLPEAIRAELGAAITQTSLNRYPQDGAALRQQIAEVMGVPDGFSILLGNGSDELIHLVIQACAQPGAIVLAPSPTFVMYEMSALFNGMEYMPIALRPDFTLDMPALLNAIEQHNPALIFIAYPNNPTGLAYDSKDIDAILRAASGLVVIDEAYRPFARDSYLERLPEFDNLLVIRTLSKLGLAGIRLGYMVGRPDLLAEFNKVRPPYNVSVLNQAAAQVVLRHLPVLDAQAGVLCAERETMCATLGALAGVTVYPSDANFILLRFANQLASGEPGGVHAEADRIFGVLRDNGILIKNLSRAHPLLNGCLRITIGTPEENQRVLEVLRGSIACEA